MEIIGNTDEPHLEIRSSVAYCLLSVSWWLLFAIFCWTGSVFLTKYLLVPTFLSLSWAYYQYFSKRNVVFFLSKQTLKIKTGLLSYTIITLELYRIKDYVVTQNFFFRFFNLMTLTLYTTDKQGLTVSMPGIPVSNLSDTIRSLVQAARANSKIVEFN